MDLGKLETEVEDTTGKIYRMRLRPYRTINNVIDGVVITFDDITQLKQLIQENRLAVIVKDSNDAVLLHDFDGNILAWNRGAIIMYGYSEAEALKMNILDIVPAKRQFETNLAISKLREEEEGIKSIVTERISKNGKIVHVWLTVTRMIDDKGLP